MNSRIELWLSSILKSLVEEGVIEDTVFSLTSNIYLLGNFVEEREYSHFVIALCLQPRVLHPASSDQAYSKNILRSLTVTTLDSGL
jgi:hypothetical protein